MNSAPYESAVAEVKSGTFTLPWRMWLATITNILTGVQYNSVSSYQSPLTGFYIQASSAASKLVLSPAGTLAAGTVVLPATPFEGMEFRVCSTETITSFSLTAISGQVVKNPPSTLAAGAGVGYTYSVAAATWFRLY